MFWAEAVAAHPQSVIVRKVDAIWKRLEIRFLVAGLVTNLEISFIELVMWELNLSAPIPNRLDSINRRRRAAPEPSN